MARAPGDTRRVVSFVDGRGAPDSRPAAANAPLEVTYLSSNLDVVVSVQSVLALGPRERDELPDYWMPPEPRKRPFDASAERLELHAPPVMKVANLLNDEPPPKREEPAPLLTRATPHDGEDGKANPKRWRRGRAGVQFADSQTRKVPAARGGSRLRGAK